MNDAPDNRDELHSEDARHIASLIAGYICQSLKPAEQQQLDDWIAASDNNMLLFEELTDKDTLAGGFDWMDSTHTLHRLYKIKAQLKFTRPVRIANRRWYYIAAASVILVIGTVGYFIYKMPDRPLPPVVLMHKQDVAPGGDKAMLTLADGKTIVLEDAKEGVVASQGNGQVIKKPGSLEYAADDKKAQPAQLLYNTISTPRGGNYSFTLSDGTKLWLNAASSVRFPAVFDTTERKINITGEVYCEVMKNSRPFRIEVNGMEIEVLGTHLNINAYAEEATVETTLLEGAIKLTTIQKTFILRPGQQARTDKTGNTSILNDVDTEEMVAWKNGLFQFNNADLPAVMRQVSRWYDVQVTYESKMPSILTTGKAPRNINLDKLLRILAFSGVHYRIDNKNLTILP